MQEKKAIVPFVIKGILVGLLFPLCSIALCYFVFLDANDPFSISRIHSDFPLLYVIDSAPVVLGLISFIVGSQVHKANTNFNDEITMVNAELLSKNDQLNDLVVEKEVLLKEIHHRVKNNLEMVSSLLKLQSVKTKDEAAKDVMQASQNRVQSMGIIHQKLYQGENLGSIEMLDYFKNLSENIIDAYGANDRVEVSYDMQAIDLDVDTAVPIGLIVNELLTNSLKYAFPEDRNGKIQLSLQELDKNQLQLVVADNGIGQSKGSTPKGTGFGSQLVQLLTSQLQGSMQADYSSGTRLSFQLERANWE